DHGLDPLVGPSLLRRHRPGRRHVADRRILRPIAQAHMVGQAALAGLALALVLAPEARASVVAPPPGQETYWDRIMRGQSARLMTQGATLLDAGAYKQAVDVFVKAGVVDHIDLLGNMMLVGVLSRYWQ